MGDMKGPVAAIAPSQDSQLYLQQQGAPSNNKVATMSVLDTSTDVFSIILTSPIDNGAFVDGEQIDLSMLQAGKAYRTIEYNGGNLDIDGDVLGQRSILNITGKGAIVQDGNTKTSVEIPSILFSQLPAGEPVLILHVGDYNGRTNEQYVGDLNTDYPPTARIQHWANISGVPPQPEGPAGYAWAQVTATGGEPNYNNSDNSLNPGGTLADGTQRAGGGYVGVRADSRGSPAIGLAHEIRKIDSTRDVYIISICNPELRIEDLDPNGGSMAARIQDVMEEFTLIPGRTTRPRVADIVFCTLGSNDAWDTIPEPDPAPDTYSYNYQAQTVYLPPTTGQITHEDLTTGLTGRMSVSYTDADTIDRTNNILRLTLGDSIKHPDGGVYQIVGADHTPVNYSEFQVNRIDTGASSPVSSPNGVQNMEFYDTDKSLYFPGERQEQWAQEFTKWQRQLYGDGHAEQKYTTFYLADINWTWDYFKAFWNGTNFVDSLTDEYTRVLSPVNIEGRSAASVQSPPLPLRFALPEQSQQSANGMYQFGIDAARSAVLGPVTQTYPALSWQLRPRVAPLEGVWQAASPDSNPNSADGEWKEETPTTGVGQPTDLTITTNNQAGTAIDWSQVVIGDRLTFTDNGAPNVNVRSYTVTGFAIFLGGTFNSWSISVETIEGWKGALPLANSWTLEAIRNEPLGVIPLVADEPSDLYSTNYGGRVGINVRDPSIAPDSTFFVEGRQGEDSYSGFGEQDQTFDMVSAPIPAADAAVGFYPQDAGLRIGFTVKLAAAEFLKFANFSGTHQLVFQSGAQADAAVARQGDMLFAGSIEDPNVTNELKRFFTLSPTGGTTATGGQVNSAAIRDTPPPGGTVSAVAIQEGTGDNFGLLFNTGVAPATAAQQAWLAASFEDIEIPKITGSTSGSGWTTLATHTLPSGYAKNAEFVVCATRTDGIDFMKMKALGMAFYDGGAEADLNIYSQVGNQNLAFRLDTSGDDLLVEVNGNGGQDWDWEILFFSKDF
jgi:hypothetical protein